MVWVFSGGGIGCLQESLRRRDEIDAGILKYACLHLSPPNLLQDCGNLLPLLLASIAEISKEGRLMACDKNFRARPRSFLFDFKKFPFLDQGLNCSSAFFFSEL